MLHTAVRNEKNVARQSANTSYFRLLFRLIGYKLKSNKFKHPKDVCKWPVTTTMKLIMNSHLWESVEFNLTHLNVF